jgi:hypothetical protein
MFYLQSPVCFHGVLSILRLINAHKILVGKTHLGDLGLDGSLILTVWTGRYGQVACSWDLRSSGYLHSVNWLFFYLHFGTTYRSNPQGSMKTGPTVCLETSVPYYQCKMYKPPEGLRSHVHRGRSLAFSLHSSEWALWVSWKAGNFLKSVVLFDGVASFAVRHENCPTSAPVNVASDIQVIQ